MSENATVIGENANGQENPAGFLALQKRKLATCVSLSKIIRFIDIGVDVATM